MISIIKWCDEIEWYQYYMCCWPVRVLVSICIIYIMWPNDAIIKPKTETILGSNYSENCIAQFRKVSRDISNYLYKKLNLNCLSLYMKMKTHFTDPFQFYISEG